LLHATSVAYPTLGVEEIPVKCQYFGLLPAFGAVILCGALLWWGRVVSVAKNRTPHRPGKPPGTKKKILSKVAGFWQQPLGRAES
jgi:hypothetical protein